MISKLALATNILKPLETSSSIGMFVRDTAGCLVSRLGLSRSKDESREISMSEVSESLLFYFSAPILAKGGAKLFSKLYNIDKDKFTSDIKDIVDVKPDILKRIKLAKFARILSVFGLILPAVFAIAPIRNNMTLSKTGKDKFISVVGLEDKKEKENIESKNKTKSLLKKLKVITAATFAALAGVLALSKNSKFYKKAEPVFDKTIKYFDFTKKGDLELLHYGALIYPVSIMSYFYASRDKYEVMENVRRFSVTVPLLFFGEKIIQNPIYKYFDKKFNTKNFDGTSIRTYKDIFKLPKEQQNQALKSKNFAYGLTFFINTLAIASAVALLNRIETKRNYKKEQNKNPFNSDNFTMLKTSMKDFMLK